ncbi:hypothetical protein KUTeg_023799 [Tegillarca granosa]|uniref:Uncharacterized protein n=1 Tax=Tegillarca granosa TaxID=220873 RepID=A0ABQ9E338_TEGGR|nr:hypothetical protein KUTeg_023799 [Tegillarca granosa]
MFWGLWSNDPDIREHYYLSTSQYGHRICNGGCNCNEDDKIVTGCSASTVKLQGYTFDNITMDTFSSSVQDITVMQTNSFSYFGNVTFNHLTNLRKLYKYRSAKQKRGISTCEKKYRDFLILSRLQDVVHENHTQNRFVPISGDFNHIIRTHNKIMDMLTKLPCYTTS